MGLVRVKVAICISSWYGCGGFRLKVLWNFAQKIQIHVGSVVLGIHLVLTMCTKAISGSVVSELKQHKNSSFRVRWLYDIMRTLEMCRAYKVAICSVLTVLYTKNKSYLVDCIFDRFGSLNLYTLHTIRNVLCRL